MLWPCLSTSSDIYYSTNQSKVEFQANKDSLLIVPQPISIQQYLNESPEADIKNIIIVLNKIGQTGLLTTTTPILQYSNIKS